MHAFTHNTFRAAIALCAAIALWTIPAQAEAGKKTLTAIDISKLSGVADAVISPDGNTVATSVLVQRRPWKDDPGGAYTQLHVTGKDGATRVYVGGKSNVSRITWTPDGKGISFLQKRGGEKFPSLYVIPVDGGEARKIASHGAGIQNYAWDPSGKRVLFLAKDAKPKDQKAAEKKGFNAQVYEEGVKSTHLWKVDVPSFPWDSPYGEKLPKAKRIATDGSVGNLAVSQDGKTIALYVAPTALVDDKYMMQRIHLLDGKSGKLRARIENPGKRGSMALSPDSSRIAFISAEDPHDPSAGRLMLASTKGGEFRELMPGFAGAIQRVAWRDAETVLFVADEGAETWLGEIAISGGTAPKVHIEKGEVIWSGLSVASDGVTLALRGDSPTHYLEHYSFTLGQAAPKRVTDHNPWLADRALGKQEVIRHKAKDGLDLEGILISPVGHKEGKKVPLVLIVHGGPEAHVRNGWVTSYNRPGQLLAGEGYAVFYPNYRGSTGRGVPFSKTSQGDPAGKEFDDLVDAVDHLVAIGLAHKDKVGITGGSYGGYASAWAATYYSDRFAASAAFVGVTDLVSKIGTTDIPNEMFMVHYLVHPWEKWNFFLERSPVFHADKSQTPTLLLHGKDDPRVDPGQSLELYRHLKLRGKAPVRLILYPGEGHGNRKAPLRFDYSVRLMRWFDHYLKGPGGEMPPYEIDFKAELGIDDKKKD